MLISNELPRLNYASGALASRMILLKLSRSWFGKEDTGLTGRLLKELPGILLWAIGGWQRLQQRGRFVQPESAAQLRINVTRPAGTTAAGLAVLMPGLTGLVTATVAAAAGRSRELAE